jgi:hypothetical protein
VEGEEVDDPDELKGDPIPGGPTDPDTPNLRMDKASPAESSQSDEGDSESDEGDSESAKEASGGDREE